MDFTITFTVESITVVTNDNYVRSTFSGGVGTITPDDDDEVLYGDLPFTWDDKRTDTIPGGSGNESYDVSIEIREVQTND